MAISLAFGVLFSTVITLFLVPSLYLMQNDYLKFIGLGANRTEASNAPLTAAAVNLTADGSAPIKA
jgi:hypothetical protein